MYSAESSFFKFKSVIWSPTYTCLRSIICTSIFNVKFVACVKQPPQSECTLQNHCFSSLKV
jgi:hypothetical protein